MMRRALQASGIVWGLVGALILWGLVRPVNPYKNMRIR